MSNYEMVEKPKRVVNDEDQVRRKSVNEVVSSLVMAPTNRYILTWSVFA